jgi:cytochrome c-type biogenesis protein
MVDNIYISTVFIAGVLSFFSPCILPVIPVYIAYFTEGTIKVETNKKRMNLLSIPMLKAILFVSGISTSFILLGFGAGALGSVLYGDWFLTICGIIVVILGIHQTGLVKLKFLNREKKVTIKRSKKSDFIGAYLLGFTFSFGWTPCVGPVLAAVLGLSASEGSAAYGGFLMLIYSIGLMIPFLIMAVFSDYLLSRIRGLYKHMNKIKIVGGILIILMGLLLMTNKITIIIAWFERLIN